MDNSIPKNDFKRNITQRIRDALLAFINNLGVFFTAGIPALFTGYSIYDIFLSQNPERWFLALCLATVAAIGIEAGGIKIVHTAVEYHSRKTDKDATFWLLVMFSVVYVIVVFYTVQNTEGAFPDIIKNLGSVSPIITVMMYFAVAVSRGLETERSEAIEKRKEQKTEITKARERQAEVEAENREHKRQMELKRLELKHQEKMAKLTVQPVVQSNGSKKLSKAGKKAALVEICRLNPDVQISEIMDSLEIKSRQTVYTYLDELENDKIIHRNGKGVEVLR